ncbi:reverse transcriptase domain protein [Colletotrichum sojae]|uniref:RNA-directed DNA polymerase n=1 Tax=Colletotrichum sojae TaxID=2175907 RepID=A0A8H6IMF5_9PEZI|nr:reverse transcriptase domain protein [Colletotrichum sojae]
MAHALVDSGCDIYAMVDRSLVKHLHLPLVDRKKRRIRGYSSEGPSPGDAQGVAVFDLELSGHTQKIYAHVVKGLDPPIFLGKPWMEANRVVYDAAEQRVSHGVGGVTLYLSHQEEPEGVRAIRAARLLPAAPFAATCRRLNRQRDTGGARVMAVSLADIEKALQPKAPVDPSKLVPAWVYSEFKDLFDPKKAYPLPPRRPGIDHKIPLVLEKNGKDPLLPWGPLYNMSREELLVLKKTLEDLLDKGFIKASSSPAGAPVLFVKKPGGGIRFCVDYRALNAITRKDRYPLPLILETLRRVAAAKWYTKLDVVAAFHKVRIAEEDQEKTAFRTRYGLFEWLVCPFGLTGAPATFQRYINSTLREWLDDFVTAYLDDVLVYTSGSKKDHEKHVRMVLRRLADAGLNLDPKKCEFSMKRVKYVGFIVTAGEGISCDPEKLRAIREWLPPRSVKGVRSFLGFANYYRIFIPNYATIVEPLTRLTKKSEVFHWGPTQEAAFQELKRLFAMEPVLRRFDPEGKTIVESDCSGFALGGTLMQEDADGYRHPVAFHSQKLSPAEYNYPIHDKELLAVLACLRAWRAELRSVGSFKVLTDHKSLEYFMKKQRLTERQSRWAEELAQYDFYLEYRPGKEAVVPDALSRREQDAPQGWDDEREQGRVLQLIPDTASPQRSASDPRAGRATQGEIPRMSVFGAHPELQDLWDATIQDDEVYTAAYTAVKQQDRSFPLAARLKVQIAECAIDDRQRLTFRGRIWVPGGTDDDDPRSLLRTRIVQECHDSSATAHPGRNGTLDIVSRRFFWPGQSQTVRRFVRNCDVCGGTHIWRQAKKGFLKPLPVPLRAWSDLSMDFITDLPPTKGRGARYLWVIVDRLTKAVTLEEMETMDARACAQRFLSCHYRTHGMPRTIVSDRGSNWVSDFWKEFCSLTGITQLLSTAYHPQTDGGTERYNQEIQAILRAFVTYAQDDWGDQLPMVQLALRNRTSSSTGVSPFFFEHGFHVDPLPVTEHSSMPAVGSKGRDAAAQLVQRIKDVTAFAQAAIVSAQQRQEESANRHRGPADRYQVGDKVWLNVTNYTSPRPSKKLSWLHHKYEVKRVVSPLVVELNVPGRIHPRFHVDLLRRASDDPLPGQRLVDAQPPPIKNTDDEDEWYVEDIYAARWHRGARQALVKWEGFVQPTWEPVEAVADTEALDRYEGKYGDIGRSDGDPAYTAPRPRRRRTGGGGGG